jgi:hypothetical protein
MKIVFSRKGFDSSSGGGPSLHFIDTGRLLSLPIPEVDRPWLNAGMTYDELRFDGADSYLDRMEKLGYTGFRGATAHLDPDLSPNVLEVRPSGWRGIFGQCESSAAHLINQKIGSGDLFLFFGWFRDVVLEDKGYRFVKGTDRHVLWGYLQVGEVEWIGLDSAPVGWKTTHPHFRHADWAGNTAFIGREHLSFAPHLPGFGTFPFREEGILTCPGQRKRSVWRLPGCFHPDSGTRMSYHDGLSDRTVRSRWSRQGEDAILQTVGRGQEFVVNGGAAVEDWVQGLFRDPRT